MVEEVEDVGGTDAGCGVEGEAATGIQAARERGREGVSGKGSMAEVGELEVVPESGVGRNHVPLDRHLELASWIVT